MRDLAVRVDSLAKRYQLKSEAGSPRYRTLRDDLVNLPLHAWRALRRRLQTQRDEFWALRDVSFEIRKGEVLGVIGRNGAGKSTLLKILSRIVSPTNGVVDLYGRVGSLLEVGAGFHPELTGQENIYLSGAVLGLRRSEIRARFDEIVAFADVERFLSTPCKHYSSGMYTRLGFAVAAHLDAEILLVDEVLAVGDSEFQKKCLGKIGQVARSGRTVLFVSHNLSAISQFCSKGLLLEKGRIKFVGSAKDAVAGYLGDPGNRSPAVLSIAEKSHHREYGGTANVRLCQASLLGAPSAEFSVYWKSPIQLEFVVEVPRAIGNVVFGFALSTQEGATLLSCHRYAGEGLKEGESLGVGRYKISLQVLNPLRPGKYIIAFGAHNAISRDILFLVSEVAYLEVLEISKEGEHGPTSHRAHINTTGEWTINSAVD